MGWAFYHGRGIPLGPDQVAVEHRGLGKSEEGAVFVEHVVVLSALLLSLASVGYRGTSLTRNRIRPRTLL